MERIKAVQAEKSMPDQEELCHGLRTDFHQMEKTLREQEQHLLGSNRKLQDLAYKVDIIENTLVSERRQLDAKSQQSTTLNDRLNDLKRDRNTLLQQVQQLEVQRNAMRDAKPNLKDQQTMERGLKKLKYYKQLTGVRWDFTAEKGTIKGYVTNGLDRAHSFAYQDHERDSDIQSLLWKEVEAGTVRSEVAETDENKVPDNR